MAPRSPGQVAAAVGLALLAAFPVALVLDGGDAAAACQRRAEGRLGINCGDLGWGAVLGVLLGLLLAPVLLLLGAGVWERRPLARRAVRAVAAVGCAVFGWSLVFVSVRAATLGGALRPWEALHDLVLVPAAFAWSVGALWYLGRAEVRRAFAGPAGPR